jgi:class 3 adenylate cyclase/tetratricopeptide (TPR) repeat protein
VSALFADLVGFTSISESMDPEDIRSMLLRYFDLARDVVETFGGEIDKYTGDAVTAFWGAHQAREDDAERAVRAALELVEAVAELGGELGIPDLQLRAGVLSGEASVGSGGNQTGLVVGDIVNTAARLQSAAEPGTVLVGESTRSLTASTISYDSVGMVGLKGKSAPVDAYQALIEVPAASAAVRPVFVGREPEMRILADQLQVVANDGVARLVSIVGDGGIGKTRLASEFQARLSDPSQYWQWGRSPAYGDGITFWALGEMVRQRAGIARADGLAPTKAKLESALASFCTDGEEAAWMLSRLEGLLGLEEVPAGGREELYGALRTFFQRVAAQGPVVMVFEDAQWADEGILDFVVDLVERSHNHPILVVTLARPELLGRHPGWGASRRGFTSIHLGPLSDRDMASLVTKTVPGISQLTADLIVGAAAGVPLYAVEYVRMLLESGDLAGEGDGYRQVAEVESLEMPDSVHAVVAARLDALDLDLRAMVQEASVLGQSFPVERLLMATDRTSTDVLPMLDRLVKAEVLHFEEDPRSPERGQYSFVQAMIREVAYGRLSRAERKQRHLAIASRFEGAGPEYAGIVASHHMSALEVEEDPELAAKARDALIKAAGRALDLHAEKQALSLVEQALAIPGEDSERVSLWEVGSKAASAAHQHDRAFEMANQALDWWEDDGDETAIIGAATQLANVAINAERPREAIEALEPRFSLDRASDPMISRLGLLLGWAHESLGEERQAADLAGDLLKAADQHGDKETVIRLLHLRGYVLLREGRFYEADALLMEAARLAREIGSLTLESSAISALTFGEGRNGRLRDLEMPLRLRDISGRAASPAMERRAVVWMSRILTASGEFEQARAGYRSLDISGDGLLDRYDRSRVGFLDWVIDGELKRLDDSDAEMDLSGSIHEIGESHTFVDSVRAQNAFARDDAEAAYEYAMSAEHSKAVPHSFLFDVPLLAALRMRDADRVRKAREILSTTGGLRFDSLAALAAASGEILTSGSEESLDRFLKTAEHHGTVDGGVETAKLKAMVAEILPDRPKATQAAREAQQWFQDHGAKGYLGLYGRAWETIPAS